MADVSQFGNTKKIPSDLYELCLTNIVNYLQKSKCDKDDVRSLPDSVLMDVYYKMFQEKRLCNLGAELSELDIFERLLRHSGAQLRLLQCFQAVIEHGSKLSTEVTTSYLTRCDKGAHSAHYLIHLGLRLGGFLNEAGWYADAERVLLRCRDICQAQPQTIYFKRLTLECCHRLLTTQSSYCLFPAAAETCALTLRLLGLTEDGAPVAVREDVANASVDVATNADEQHSIECACSSCRSCGVKSCGVTSCSSPETSWSAPVSSCTAAWLPPPTSQGSSCASESVSGWDALQATTLAALSALSFARCDYSAAYAWSLKALRLLKPYTPPQITVEVLGACGKACVVKRKFARAGVVLRGAVALARDCCGTKHPRYANALLDYGFFLLNIDSINHSVAVYEEALSTLRQVFGRSSLHVAGAQEDLAYALYVLEYTSGRFYKAREHAERAIRIIETLVPPEHLLLASAKRVKALILEEIALDAPAPQGMSEASLLEESEALHKSALNLSMMAFGEKNVQTAKHYGNLGRLYQSMQKFQDAETMHLKAIAIKEELLGPEDYEVGLSIGHLASLYNYHMNMHNAAEKLYFRSIAINLKLFGERYSGLEYDYRGLVNVFTKLKRHDRAHFYTRLLHHWHELREQSRDEQQPAIGDETIQPLEELQACFFANAD